MKSYLMWLHETEICKQELRRSIKNHIPIPYIYIVYTSTAKAMMTTTTITHILKKVRNEELNYGIYYPKAYWYDMRLMLLIIFACLLFFLVFTFIWYEWQTENAAKFSVHTIWHAIILSTSLKRTQIAFGIIWFAFCCNLLWRLILFCFWH